MPAPPKSSTTAPEGTPQTPKKSNNPTTDIMISNPIQSVISNTITPEQQQILANSEINTSKSTVAPPTTADPTPTTSSTPSTNTPHQSQPLETGDDKSDEPAKSEPVQHGDDDEDELVEDDCELDENGDPVFPIKQLEKLDDMINKPRWVVPVLPEGELEVLIKAAIKLSAKGLDERCAVCLEFYKEGLTISFTKILTDEAVTSWKNDIQRYIMENCKLLIDLCVNKLPHDSLVLLELLAMVLNPQTKFHMYNSNKAADMMNLEEDQIYSRSPDTRSPPKGWLVDLLNRFGRNKGFELVKNRFTLDPEKGKSLSFGVIAALIKPFGQCHEVLTVDTIKRHFIPVVDIVTDFLDELSDEELKKESKTEAKNDALSGIMKGLKALVAEVPGYEERIKSLEIFRLKMILRLLKISSFNGKMNALNELNKVIMNVSYYYQRHTQGSLDTEEWLTADKMAEWIKENQVLSIVLHGSLHQPQYVEKLEKILRFMIKEKALSPDHLDKIWMAQHGKHDAIVKNIHDMLAKLAWDFAPEQLDHLFKCFQDSWNHANKKQREKLLELIRRLAEDDKEGIMAQKVLSLLWKLAKADDCPTDTMDQALAALIKILDYSCSQERDKHKMEWIQKFVEELKNNEKWVLPALKQIMEICRLFPEPPASYQSYPPGGRLSMYYRNVVINELQSRYSIVMTVATSLVQYINHTRIYKKGKAQISSVLLKDGQLWLCAPQAIQIWNCLAINAVYDSDREACFKWFTKLMGEEPDLDPDITKDFFEDQILKLDPTLLTESGMSCFERFFRNVNTKDTPRLLERRRGLVMDDLNLIGMDYLWRVILQSSETVSSKAIALMKELHANLGPKLHSQRERIHGEFIAECFERLKGSYKSLELLADKDSQRERQIESNRMCRVFEVLKEYISECDEMYSEERQRLPLSCSSHGKYMSVLIKIPNPQGGRPEELEISTHSNETIGGVKRQFLQHHKMSSANVKVEFYLDGELLEPQMDRKILCKTLSRDKSVLTAKLCATNSNVPSASDSSDESSPSPSPALGHNDGPNEEAERCLPGVILASDVGYIPFLHQVCDLANSVRPELTTLMKSAKGLLYLSPPHQHTIEDIREICKIRAQHANSNTKYTGPKLESKLFSSSAAKQKLSPSEACYVLEVVYSLIMPCNTAPAAPTGTVNFIQSFIESDGMSIVLKALTQSGFMNGADTLSKRDALLLILKIAKVILLTSAYSKVFAVIAILKKGQKPPPEAHQHASNIQDVVNHLPYHCIDPTLKYITTEVATRIADKGNTTLPDEETIKFVQRIIWSSASSNLTLLQSNSTQDMQKSIENMSDENEEDEDLPDTVLACTGLEVLTLCYILHPDSLSGLHKDKTLRLFIADMILLCKNRLIRSTAQEQFQQLAVKCQSNFFITLLFTFEMEKVPQYANQSQQYFSLLCYLLRVTQMHQPLNNAEQRLTKEIEWLKKMREDVISVEDSNDLVNEILLEGHLGLARELVLPLPADKKYRYGSHPEGACMIKELMEDYLFPASKILVDMKQGLVADIAQRQVNAICQSPTSISAAYDLIEAFCTQCLENLKLVCQILSQLFYQGQGLVLNEWEYLPPVGSRPPHGFVGLKNGGATCYMNSVLQQLFLMPQIRNAVIKVEGAVNDLDEAEETMDEMFSLNSPPSYSQLYPEKNFSGLELNDSNTSAENQTSPGKEDSNEKTYHLGVLKQVQIIFAHLQYSKLQFFTPRGFWKQFRIQGEQVNLREQHDALEFFARLVDSCDEALKTLDQPEICKEVLGGSYADQKICKDCPHRYSQEQPFSFLSLEIRNHQHLKESLEQFVKGDLLEGANAYYCERCCKKVDTVKRMCVRKLPKMLAIQLKRFDYDWERECPIKFNDYFEFPRELDMEPYTVYGLAKMEGEPYIDEDGVSYASQGTQYRLTGVVVHSGQASGGHYYSYIKQETSQGESRWYKFDDGDVSECHMEDDEELKKECFGGEYSGEVFDHMLKRMSFRRQKRWWNGYILMYERVSEDASSSDNAEASTSEQIANIRKEISQLSLNASGTEIKIPLAIGRIVRRQNLEFMHNRNQFCQAHFTFMKKLISCNTSQVVNTAPPLPPDDLENLAFISVSLASQFLFSVAFHTKKTLRGPAADWYEALSQYFRVSKKIRLWFAENVLFAHPERFSEYLLESTSSDVRSTFAKIIAFLAHLSRVDGVTPPPRHLNIYEGTGISSQGKTLSDHLLMAVLALLRKEVSENGRQIAQYFHLFFMYANLGPEERKQLLSLNVLGTFISVALDEGPGPTIKYQFTDLQKLYSVVSILLRCCDLSSECQTQDGRPVPQNPLCLSDQPLIPVQPAVSKLLYKSRAFIKKVIEDNINHDETRVLLQCLSFENSRFSAEVLTELLWQVAYTYTYEMRPYLDLLHNILSLEDSWQSRRITTTLNGLNGDKEGLLEIIQRSRASYQKRSYQCIKMLVNLMSESDLARKVVVSDKNISSRWNASVEWLNDELEKRTSFGSSTQYSYNNWSPPQSNESSNGYFLERSNSARVTLAKALALCSEEDSGDTSELSIDNLEAHDNVTESSPQSSPKEDDPTTSVKQDSKSAADD